MWIFQLIQNGNIVPHEVREEADRYFLLDDGVTLHKKWINNDTVHFSTRAKAEHHRSKYLYKGWK